MRSGALHITEEAPLHLKHLFSSATVYPDRIECGDETRRLADITHLEWNWHSLTINLINHQDTTLILHSKGHSTPLKLRRRSMYKAPKLVMAYEYIAQQTFEQRLEQYLSQLEQHGFFEYQGHKFYSDGRVKRGDSTLSLQHAEYQPFRLTVSDGGFFGTRFRIDLRVDRDVIVALLDHIQRHPRTPESVCAEAQRRTQSQKVIAELTFNLGSLLVKLGAADGELCARERRLIGELLENALQRAAPNAEQLDALIAHALASPRPFEYFARKLVRGDQMPHAFRELVLDALFSVALADDELSAEEEILLQEAEVVFGIPSRKYAAHKANRTGSTSGRPQGEHSDFRVLGLSPSATNEQIKGAYRRLVMRYHPDRAHHMGEAFVAETEAQIKLINAAYKRIRVLRRI